MLRQLMVSGDKDRGYLLELLLSKILFFQRLAGEGGGGLCISFSIVFFVVFNLGVSLDWEDFIICYGLAIFT